MGFFAGKVRFRRQGQSRCSLLAISRHYHHIIIYEINILHIRFNSMYNHVEVMDNHCNISQLFCLFRGCPTYSQFATIMTASRSKRLRFQDEFLDQNSVDLSGAQGHRMPSDTIR